MLEQLEGPEHPHRVIRLDQVEPIPDRFLISLDRLVGADGVAEDLDPQGMTAVDEGLGEDRPACVDRVGPDPLGDGIELRRVAEGRHPAQGGRDRLELLEVGDALIHDRPVGQPVPRQRFDQGFGGDILGVDVEPDARGCRGVEEGVEGGHPRPGERAAEPRAGIQHRDLGGGPLADRSPARRGPIERAVVEEHEGPVACGPHVELDVIGPKGQGLPERFQRVLGGVAPGPAVVRHLDAAGRDPLLGLARQDFLGAVGPDPIDPGRGHAVPDLRPVVVAEGPGLDLDAGTVERAAGLRGHVGGVDLDRVRADVLDPCRQPEGRPPLRHQAHRLAGDAADRAELVGARTDDHLAAHLRREHLAGEQGGIDIFAIEAQIDPSPGEPQPFLQRQDPFAGEPTAELGTRVGGADFRERAVAHAPGRVGTCRQVRRREEDVVAVARPADGDLGPLHRVRDRRLDGTGRFLGSQPRPDPVRHDLDGPGGLHRLEERESAGRWGRRLREEDEEAGEGDHGVPEPLGGALVRPDFRDLDAPDGDVGRGLRVGKGRAGRTSGLKV